MLKIFITQSNREISICDRVRKILCLMTKFAWFLSCVCVLLVDMKLKTGDHLFIGVCGCCGPHKLLVQCGSHKRIIRWGRLDYKIWTTILPTESIELRLFQPESYISGLYNLKSLCNPETIIQTTSESFGRWSAPHKNTFVKCFGLWSSQENVFLHIFWLH